MKRGKKRKSGFMKIAFIFVLAAVVIKLLDVCGAEQLIMGYMRKLSGNEKFINYAISGETQVIGNNEREKLLKSFFF